MIPAGQACHLGHRHQPSEAFDLELAAEVGLPAPPPGRIWLLRSPWPLVGLKVVLWFFARRCQERGVYEVADFVAAARAMLRWDETELLAWWTGQEKDAALAWQVQGRTGEDVAELVYAGIGPQELARMPGLTFDQAAAWRWAAAGQTVQEAVDRVVFFRSAGLPDTPPENLYRLEGLTEEEFRAWIAAGFDVPTMVALIGSTLAEAIAWRDHGFSAARAQELLQADPELTAVEADSFTAAGIVGRHQIDWIQYGFSAAEATGYDQLDIQPNEARVWRSMGLSPSDAQPGHQLPPDYQRGGWIIPAGMRMRDGEHFVKDPPGTRGVIAERSAQHRQRPR